MIFLKQSLQITFVSIAFLMANTVQAQVLPEASLGIKITLTKKATSRPMTIAYIPSFKRYYIADGGLAPMASEDEAPASKSMIHTYDDTGKFLSSAKPGYDNRSIYYNQSSDKLETVTYNISSGAGFSPNTGIYVIRLNDNHEATDASDEVIQANPAFGDAGTMPTYDAEKNVYYAKQERGNKVLIVDHKKREPIGELALDLAKAGVAFDDISDHYVAFTGVKGNELILLDVDHKAALVFDLAGKFVAKSELPKDMKLRSQNHFNGLGYANDMLFIYHEGEGEFGTYYGFTVVKP